MVAKPKPEIIKPKIETTKTLATNYVNMLLYGRPGIGKTVALATAPEPLILSAEAGLLSLLHKDVPYVAIRSIGDLRDVYRWLMNSDEANQYRTVCIDSISEVCDMAFVDAKSRVGNEIPVLYSELRTTVLPLLSSFRNIPKHTVVTARETVKQSKRDTITMPTMVGNKLTDDLPYLYDIVLHYTLDDNDRRIIYTDSECGSVAKDRTGLLPKTITDTSNLVTDVISLFTGNLGGANDHRGSNSSHNS